MNKIKQLKEVKPKINQDLVTLLNQAMEAVLSGQVIGLIMLTNNTAGEFGHASAGDMELGDALNSFHSWEFDQRTESYLEQQRSGK